MNCSTVEKWIYLFDELEEEDRARVNRHIASCPACQKVYLRVRDEKDILRRTLATPTDIANHARLTSNIMAAIRREDSRRSSFFDLAAWYFSKPVQYSLLTLSLFLGIFFLVQYNQSTRLASSGSYVHLNQLAATVELNSTLFYREFNRTKQPGISTATFSVHQCLRACQKLSTNECFACKSKFTKLNKQYETI